MRLSIAIPTFNRALLLDECLGVLVPQILSKSDVEVLIVDNASTDRTENIVQRYLDQGQIRYFRNFSNEGYGGSQRRCIEEANGDYTAILCDDDIYLPGQVDRLLEFLSREPVAFLAQNYCSFSGDYRRPHKTEFAPEEDRVFRRAYDVMNHPSVGHFSGFVFNSTLAKSQLSLMLKRRPVSDFEPHRGLVSELATRVTAHATLPAVFLGKRGVAARVPADRDYDDLGHLCVDYLTPYVDWLNEGIITESDYEYRVNLVMAFLWRAIVKDAFRYSAEELRSFETKLTLALGHNTRFRAFEQPLLKFARVRMVRAAYRRAFLGYRRIRGKKPA